MGGELQEEWGRKGSGRHPHQVKEVTGRKMGKHGGGGRGKVASPGVGVTGPQSFLETCQTGIPGIWATNSRESGLCWKWVPSRMFTQ